MTVLQGVSKKIGPRYQSRLNILGCFALLHALRTGKPQIPSTTRRGWTFTPSPFFPASRSSNCFH